MRLLRVLLALALLPGAAAAQRLRAPLAPVRTAVSGFALGSGASAVEARQAGSLLMAGALGDPLASASPFAAAEPVLAPAAADGPAPLARPTEPEPKPISGTYLLSTPLREHVELGRAARALHYVLEILNQFIGPGLLWWGGQPEAAVGLLAVNAVKTPPMITMQSLLDLGVRYAWRKRAWLRELAAVPGVERLSVLTTRRVTFSGVLARSVENTGLVFAEVKGPPAPSFGRFGAPSRVPDLGGPRVRVSLQTSKVAELETWTPTLRELLDGAAMPDRIAAEWRRRLREERAGKPLWRRWFDFGGERDLRVEASLMDGGSLGALGTLAFGRGAKKLMGWNPRREWLGRKLEPGALPVSRHEVVKRGRGASLLWGRLTGRLIAAD